MAHQYAVTKTFGPLLFNTLDELITRGTPHTDVAESLGFAITIAEVIAANGSESTDYVLFPINGPGDKRLPHTAVPKHRGHWASLRTAHICNHWDAYAVKNGIAAQPAPVMANTRITHVAWMNANAFRRSVVCQARPAFLAQR